MMLLTLINIQKFSIGESVGNLEIQHKDNKDIVIKGAEKGASVVVMSAVHYVWKAEEILSNKNSCKTLLKNNDKQYMNKIRSFNNIYGSEMAEKEKLI